ncbi:MAG: hypothetical protein ACKVWV_13590 [Planctomycetota bacterium]
MTARAIGVLLVAFVLCAMPLYAQELVPLESRVTAISGSSVYVDLGREDRVEVGDRVLFHPSGTRTVEGTIRSVAKTSSRAEIAPASPPLTVGVRAEIFVPKERLAPPAPVPEPPVVQAPTPSAPDAPSTITPGATTAPAPPSPTTLEHPPWTHPPESWAEDLPLLAPAFARAPEERAQRLDGRLYLQSHHTWDSQGEGRRYLLTTMGLDMRLENPFGQGGSFDVRAEVFQRDVALPDAADEHDTEASLHRFTYWFGGTEDRPTRWQLGRFLQHEFPELGVLDGVEWSRRTESGDRFGISAGSMPEPYPGMRSVDDVQAAVYYRWVDGPDERVAIGGAFQNTWHRGDQDRSLLVATLDYRSSEKFSLRSSAWIDSYDSSDVVKSSGLELTEARIGASYQLAPGSGVGLNASHARFPELLRDEFTSVDPEILRDGRVDRIGLTGWHELTERTRVSARADHWEDQDDSGAFGEAEIAWRDILYPRGELSLALSHTDGSYSSGPGLRVGANKSFDEAFASIAYTFADFEQKDFTGAQSTLAHHALYGSVDFTLSSKWDLSLFAENRFGDEQDAYSLGFLLQTRF